MGFSNDQEGQPRWPTFVCAALAISGFALAVFYVAHFWVFTADDAYIVFRYSRVLAREGALRVSTVEGQSVEGYVQFLWVILNVIPELFGFSSTVFSKLLGLAAVVAMLGMLKVVVLDKRHFFALVAAVCGHPFTWVHAVGGLETSLYALLAVALFLLFAERWLWDSTRSDRANQTDQEIQ